MKTFKTIFMALCAIIFITGCSRSGHRKPKPQDSTSVVMTTWDSMQAEFDMLHAEYNEFISESGGIEGVSTTKFQSTFTFTDSSGLPQAISFGKGTFHRMAVVTKNGHGYSVECPPGKRFMVESLVTHMNSPGIVVLSDTLPLQTVEELQVALLPIRSALSKARIASIKQSYVERKSREEKLSEMAKLVQ